LIPPLAVPLSIAQAQFFKMFLSLATATVKVMIYKLEGDNMLFTIDRTKIIDISVNDKLEVKGFPGATHVWTEQDMEFIENNPDDDIYLQVERVSENKYRASGIMLKQ